MREHSADHERLLPWLIVAFTIGFGVFFGALKLIVWVAS